MKDENVARNPKRDVAKHMFASMITIAVLSLAGFMALLFFAQRRLVFPVSREIYRTPDQAPYRLIHEDLYLPVSGGKITNAWFFPCDNAQYTVLFCRGNGGTLSDWLDAGVMFHNAGFAILLFDYGGYGRSTGRPSESRLYEDGRAAWRWLTEARKIPPRNIVLIGHSIGGGVAAQLATEITPAALILQSTFTSLPDVAQEMLPFLYVKPFIRDRFNTIAKLARISCPLLVVHSPNDSLIPFAHGRALFDRAREPKRFLEIRGDHNDGMFSANYLSGIASFIASLAR
ncbi:MAG TPA: alpha/beta hydrolase [Candidatus Hydrogenedentes bacterium]|nr:alpha/beta hydrolase [Candidatus Hydrogenedentota bacterium]HRT21054.1 alpha/beta hydrolase [Candidatus Hydrogenedentota bacterium]HRT65883.1 alpha/beta hydrolase [Candidatus Hydrogenedentota bacterium]